MKARTAPAFLSVLATLLLAAVPPVLAELGDCGQPQSTGAGPKTSDALATLKSAVGTESACDAEPCVCDVNADEKVSSSDALRILQAAVGQDVVLVCSCDPGACTVLGDAPASIEPAPATAALGVQPMQVLIEARIIGVDRDSYDALNLGAQWTLSSPVTTDDGPPPGGTNGAGTLLAVDSDASGGPAGLQYLLYGNHAPEAALPILNKNFVSPFTAVKSYFLLPTDGCVEFAEGTTSVPMGFPAGNPVQNLAPADAKFGGSEVLYSLYTMETAAALLSAIEGDNRNTVLTAPTVTVYSGQSVLHVVDDVEPQLADIIPSFRSNIQAVTPDPFGNFTGVTLDLVPTIMGDSIKIDVRLGTEALSFYFSTAFQVDGAPADAEILLHRRSRNMTSVIIPDGGTVVLGGLLVDGETVPDKGLPLIGRLPLLGSLFTHKQLDRDKQNLVIFITPMIVGGS